MNINITLSHSYQTLHPKFYYYSYQNISLKQHFAYPTIIFTYNDGFPQIMDSTYGTYERKEMLTKYEWEDNT